MSVRPTNGFRYRVAMQRPRGMGLFASISAAILGGHVVLAGWAVGALSGVDYAYAAPGHQYANWSYSSRLLRLGSYPDLGMNSDRCMDAMLDWQTSAGHYDARVVRSCKPGSPATKDPGGDGFWFEPSGWAGRNIVNMQKGGGARIDDDYVGGNFHMYAWKPFAGAGSGSYSARPRTCTDKWARVRTLYQDGHFASCDSDPAEATS